MVCIAVAKYAVFLLSRAIGVQVEIDEMIYYVTKSMLSANDTESQAFADHCMEATANMLQFNNDLYVGNGYSSVLGLTAEEVGILGICAPWGLPCM